MPDAHGEHMVLVEAVQEVPTDWPGVHVEHEVQTEAFAALENFPLPQAVQFVSAEALQAAAEYDPAAQTVQV